MIALPLAYGRIEDPGIDAEYLTNPAEDEVLWLTYRNGLRLDLLDRGAGIDGSLDVPLGHGFTLVAGTFGRAASSPSSCAPDLVEPERSLKPGVRRFQATLIPFGHHRRTMRVRATFLVRFTVVTFVSAGIAALALAFALDTLHRRAIDDDATMAALGRIDARLLAPLAAYGRGSARVRGELAAVAREAMLDPFVSGLRIYDDAGRPLLASGDGREAAAVRKAGSNDGFLTLERDGTRTLLQPYAAGDGDRRFVVAVDFARDQMEAQFAREARPVALLTAGAVALIFCSLVVLAAGASRELERRRREAHSTFLETLVTLAETVDLRDPYTAGHSQRVAAYSRRLALALRVAPEDVAKIENGALLHDIGKIGVPDAVLFKNGPLDRRERHLIEHHPVLGAKIIARVPHADEITPCVLHHHERVDGSGYPDGLIGDAIPLGARIIAVADAFDAMTTDRPYRRALGADEAVVRLMQGMGTQFDSRCVAAFRTLVLTGEIVPPPSTGTAVFAQRAAIELAEAI
jgi:putative nucleotidyltransferase with HDIG domain